MTLDRRQIVARLVLTAVILLAGAAILPFSSLSANPLNWQRFAGLYNPKLEVTEDRGRPGSAFHFTAWQYPPNTLATVYIDGSPIGTITTAANGTGEFLIQTDAGDPLGDYDVTLATDPFTSDTDDFRLEDDEPLIPPPPGYDGAVFNLGDPPLTPTPTPSVTPTGTPTGTPTITSTPTPTPTPTGTPVPLSNPNYMPAVVAP